jgi:FKBP-type peptidyl-prolyl cis-trans isomerase (trigger factor)
MTKTQELLDNARFDVERALRSQRDGLRRELLGIAGIDPVDAEQAVTLSHSLVDAEVDRIWRVLKRAFDERGDEPGNR